MMFVFAFLLLLLECLFMSLLAAGERQKSYDLISGETRAKKKTTRASTIRTL